ncbi:GroES-like protein [Mycena indigotica]|uniref:GroES-like protein n=1 Tax=Mycena indigotica TaxID=2126181 RepID=A0A8H6VVH1_9AGAR|nr:GroES-like protein [Mycena indigotica]KAF7295469.1 GroES-like protein [Mycena indigotica]
MSQLALVFEARGKHVLKEIAIPEPSSGLLQVRVEAAAINPVDVKIFDNDRRGFVQHYPTVLGWDAAGEVTQVGQNVAKFKVGDRIAFLCIPGFSRDGGKSHTCRGAFQQYALADQRFSVKIPADADYASAASWPMSSNTAAGSLYKHFKLTEPWLSGGEGAYKGEKILILGGSSSVGAYAIQYAVLSGFHVLTTCSPVHFGYVKSLGADVVIDRSASDVAAQIIAAASGPLKFVIDAISIPVTQLLATQVLQEAGKLNLMLSPDPSLKHVLDAKKIQLLWGAGMQGWYISEPLWDAAEVHLASGLMKFNHVTVLNGGLNAWETAFEMHRKGQVSGTKLILAPQQTVR